MITHTSQAGFSATELLITLFIAAIFLTGGYELWIQVVSAGAQSSQQAKASNSAYEYLRKYSVAGDGSACSASTPVNNSSITIDGLSNVTVTVAITCPYGSSSDGASMSKVTSTVSYGNATPQESVAHALFIQ